jgi:hypothetical protein
MQDIDNNDGQEVDDDAEDRFQREKKWDQMLENEKVKKFEAKDDPPPTPVDTKDEDIYCAIT